MLSSAQLSCNIPFCKRREDGTNISEVCASHRYQTVDAMCAAHGPVSIPSCILRFVPLQVRLKYFAVDIDGTFLAVDPEVYRRNVEAFVRVLESGVKIFFCTGRGHFGAIREMPDEVIERLGFTGYPGIYHNGGAVYDEKGQLLEHALFDKTVLKRIIDKVVGCNHMKYTMFLTLDDWYIITDDRSFFNEFITSLRLDRPFMRATAEEVLSMDIMKVIIVRYDLLAESFKDMRDVVFIAKRALNDMTDLTPMGITKGSGLALLLKSFGGSPDECGYIGDACNDLEAMRLAGHSFAVGNAIDEAKTAAKYVVQHTNDEGAFARVMDAVFSPFL
ncbi:HMP-PP phosphatase [Babesia sp. Xinjiang]|uniref:HMP-PP phosphatase n=1 Tax=Babesia sp. Xinjiang TaxID=462227 RepID=UPI000A25B324|nr:HMP-PP phosphatase [Babesia sp. Xinjiang]ORM39618.1 HMP-PP phosphatase [Babesia sp. Xinjiang]